MARFLIRIDIKDAYQSDYESMNSLMIDNGYSKILRSKSGVIFRLPVFEFTISTWSTSANVRDETISLMESLKIKKTYAVMVNEISNSFWM